MLNMVDVIDRPAPISSSARNTYHIYFIPGNPGLISYYTTFLTLLHTSLNSATSSSLPKDAASVAIYGESLGGFELANINAIHHPPFSLQRQIAHVETRISEYCKRQTSPTAPLPVKVILIGHSVGAYITLEILRRHYHRLRRESALTTSASSPSSSSSSSHPFLNVISAILLFPTVTHIAASPNGLKFAWLLRIPRLPLLVGYLARGLAWTLGGRALRAVCGVALGMTDEAAVTTAGFLGSAGGVRQAL